MDAANTATSQETFTACALVRTHTYTVKVSKWDADLNTLVEGGGRLESEETGRIEFIPAGEWVFVRVVQASRSDRTGGAWAAYTREEARLLYKETFGGKGWHGPGWTKGEAKTVIVGAINLPARDVHYSWGEGANRVALVSLPAARCPVIKIRRHPTETTSALQAFTATFDGWTSHRVQWTELSRSYC